MYNGTYPTTCIYGIGSYVRIRLRAQSHQGREWKYPKMIVVQRIRRIADSIPGSTVGSAQEEQPWDSDGQTECRKPRGELQSLPKITPSQKTS